MPSRSNKVLALPPTLTQSGATACLKELSAGIADEAAGVVVNAAALSRFDSAALAVLLAVRRQALSLGKTFEIQSLPTRLGDLAKLYGLTELLLKVK